MNCKRCIPDHRNVPGSRKIVTFYDIAGREHWHYVDGRMGPGVRIPYRLQPMKVKA